jgi:hypothetical protein
MHDMQKVKYIKQSERDKMRHNREMQHYVPPSNEFGDQPKVHTTPL